MNPSDKTTIGPAFQNMCQSVGKSCGKGVKGLLVHVGMAVNAVGRPLGMFTADADFRQAPGKDSVRWLQGLERSRELAQACSRTRVINVCDREGDFWELLAQARQTGQELLVRANHGTRRRVTLADGHADLRDHVLATEPVGCREVDIPAHGGKWKRKGRVAHLTLRATAVTLLPPKEFSTAPPLPMIAVSAREENPPARVHRKRGKQGGPLHWMLLLSSGSADLDTATTVLHWYELRWRIERFFHALKQGTRIEDRRLNEGDDSRKCFAFDAITAFHVWDLALLAQTKPNDLANKYVCEKDITVLRVLAGECGFKKTRAPPEMTIANFVAQTGGLAGFHPSKRQPLPGTEKLWEGVRKLYDGIFAIQAWENRKMNNQDIELGMLH